MTASHALAEARRRDVDRRRQRVHQALAEMRAQAAEITISSAAARARVHRSFIHRHPDLRAAVIAAAEDPATSGPAGQAPSAAGRCWPTTPTCANATAASNSTPAASKTGCPNCSAPRSASAPASAPQPRRRAARPGRQPAAAEPRPAHALEERDEELAAAREANRRLMADLNHR